MPGSEPSLVDPAQDISSYSRWPEIFRSWFWRFYDNLFRLIFYNFCWVLSCLFVGRVLIHFGWVEISKPMSLSQLFQFYFLYLVENMVSVGWAYSVFKVFMNGQGRLADIWLGTKKYFLKATAVSAVSSIPLCLGIYNLYFYLSFARASQSATIFLSALTLWILLSWLSTWLYQWPILFFQDPPFLKIFYRSFLMVLGNGLISLGILFFFALCLMFFLIVPFLLFLIGFVFFFSLQCVTLEKNFLRYKIVYGDGTLSNLLEQLEAERRRGWREILKPWGNG